MKKKSLAHITTSAGATSDLGQQFAKTLKIKPSRHALVLALQGQLGAGKTTFVQGLAKGLGIRERMVSPTFILIKKFQIPNTKLQTNPKPQTSIGKRYFYHIDCYRLEKPKELFDLGFKKIISNPANIVAVEWAEKVKKILPREVVWVRFEVVAEKKRQLEFKNQISKNQNDISKFKKDKP